MKFWKKKTDRLSEYSTTKKRKKIFGISRHASVEHLEVLARKSSLHDMKSKSASSAEPKSISSAPPTTQILPRSNNTPDTQPSTSVSSGVSSNILLHPQNIAAEKNPTTTFDDSKDTEVPLIRRSSKEKECIDFSAKKHISVDEIKKLVEISNICVKKLILNDVKCADNELLEWIAPEVPSLVHLELRWCENITGSSVKAFAENCPELEYVSLSCCSQVSAKSLMALAEKCPKLKTLDLSWVWKISDEAIEAISGLPNITELALSGCRYLTDKSLHSLEKAQSLKIIDLSRCEKFSVDAIMQLAKALPNLETLILLGIDSVTPMFVMQTFSNNFPNVRTGFE